MSRLQRIGSRAELVYRDLLGGYMERTGKRHLRDSDPSDTVPRLTDLLDEVTIERTQLSDDLWVADLLYKGVKRRSKIRLFGEFDSNKPSVIFHPTTAITMHDLMYSFLIDSRMKSTCNIFYVVPQYHENVSDIINHVYNSFENSMLTVAGSVYTVEEAISIAKEMGSERMINYGISLGGVAAGWHLYKFNSADLYIPAMSILKLDKIVLQETMSHVIDRRTEWLENRSFVNSCNMPSSFNMADYSDKVFPILGVNDTLMSIDQAREDWAGLELVEFDGGHYSIVTMASLIREEAWKIVDRQKWFDSSKLVEDSWSVLFKR